MRGISRILAPQNGLAPGRDHPNQPSVQTATEERIKARRFPGGAIPSDASNELSPVEQAARIAAHAAQIIVDVYGHSVAFVPEDLLYVDRALTDLAATGELETRAISIQLFGCLLGEVTVRSDGARWTEFDVEKTTGFGVPVGLTLPSGRLANPIGAAFKLAYGGPERSVVLFRQAALGVFPPSP
jgi:hypothetical protein